jgi:hypothetical protein
MSKQIEKMALDLEQRVESCAAVERFLWNSRQTQLKDAEKLRQLVLAQAWAAGEQRSLTAISRAMQFAKSLPPFYTRMSRADERAVAKAFRKLDKPRRRSAWTSKTKFPSAGRKAGGAR